MSGSDADYHKFENQATDGLHKSEATIESWDKEAEDLPFESAWMLIIHHIVLVALVLCCSAAPSLDIKACVTAGAVLWIALPFILMHLEMNTSNPWSNPNKYLLWDEEGEQERGHKTMDKWRAELGVHRFFVAQDKNGDVHPDVPGPDDETALKFEDEAVTETTPISAEKLTTAMRLGRRVKLDTETDKLLGVTGFQAMLGMSAQLYMLYGAVLLFCLGDMSATVSLAGEAALLDGDESLTHLRTAKKYLLCAVLLFYALSISVPSKKSASVHWLRVRALRLWPASNEMREKANKACFGKIDKTHKELYSSCLYKATGLGLPILLEIVVGTGYFCATEMGCHWPQSSFDMLSTVLFVSVGLLTLFALHAWVILEFMRLARCSIFRLQILTQELRMAIQKFDDDVFYGLREKAATVKAAAIPLKGTEAPECQIVKDHAETLVNFLRAWQVTRTFMQRHDISFFFKSIASQVGLLILCMACCVMLVLLHFFHILAVLDATGVMLAQLGLVGLWCVCIVYFQACYILQMNTTRVEQLRLLRHLELSLKSTKPHGNDKASTLALDVVSCVYDYVSEHDEPPTLLSVRVDPTFISYLHRSVAITVAGWVVSAITNRFK